jgi:8-oxo-dGTP diphosphatase
MTATPVLLTVEVVLLGVLDGRLSALLLDPGARFPARRALPGGAVGDDESFAAAAERLLRQPTAHLEQLASYGDPGRHPYARMISVAYLGLAAAEPDLRPDATWTPIAALEEVPLALDHAAIVRDGVERARSKLEYTSLAAALLAEPFRLADLRRVYEAVWGATLDPGNFRRKVLTTPGFVEPAEGVAPPGPVGGRPARLYRRGASSLLHPAMLRPGTA